MRRLFYLLIVLAYTLGSCTDNDKEIDNPAGPEHTTDVTLDISTIDLIFEASGGKKEFTIYCKSDWTITNSSSWCKMDVTNGNGEKAIAVTADVYTGTEDRNTNLTIKAGDKTKVLTITQKQKDAIILTKDKFDVSQEENHISIEVKSNVEYQVAIPTSFQGWIKQAVESKALTAKNFSFTISANENLDKREGYIVFSGNSLKDTVYVYQAPKNQLILTEDTYNVPAEGKNIAVQLRTNVDYDVVIPDSVKTWVSLIQTKAVRTDQLHFSIAESETYHDRRAIVIIKDKNSDLTDTLYINQLQKNALILTQKKYNIKAEGETITVELKTNTDYNVIIPDSVANWIKSTPTKSMTTYRLTFTISANSTNKLRNGVVIFNDKNGKLSDSLRIYQKIKEKIINIPDPNFKQYLIQHWDSNRDGEISISEIKDVETLACSGKEIKSLEGIQYFENLTVLECSNNELTHLDVSKNIKLESLTYLSNPLEVLNLGDVNPKKYYYQQAFGVPGLSKFQSYPSIPSTIYNGYVTSQSLKIISTKIKRLYIKFQSSLQNLDISECTALETLEVTCSGLITLDASSCPSLKKLDCDINQLETLYLNNPYLISLHCSANQLVNIDCSNCPILDSVDFTNNPLMKVLNFGNVKPSKIYRTGSGYMNYPDIADGANVKIISTQFNKIDISSFSLQSLDVSQCSELIDLNFYNTSHLELLILNNKITKFVESGQWSSFCSLEMLKIVSHKLIYLSLGNIGLKALDISECSVLETLYCSNTPNLKTIYMKSGQIVDSLKCIDSKPEIQYKH